MALHRSPEQAEREAILQSLLALRRDLQEVLEILRGGAPGRALVVEPGSPVGEPVSQSLRDSEREMIAAALAAVGGNRRLAAQQLGIAERTLYRKLKSYGLS